eukprot:GILI01011879.1.p1 GENE.GILI01011879.1~~GILI01011879.1.p1  ORF type:complete len:244 (-),score=21.72 GILI01011879.1:14-745(-)
MQYDESGYPVKGNAATTAGRTLEAPPATAAPATSSSVVSQDSVPAPPRPTSGPIYDEGGAPIKPQRQDQSTEPLPTNTNRGELVANQTQQAVPCTQAMPVAAYGVQNFEMIPQTSSYWSTGYCEMCADQGVFLDGLCCFPCQTGRLHDAIANDQSDSFDAIAFCFTCCCGTAFPLYTIMDRRSLIRKYGIEGESACCTFLLTCLCPNISSCQMHRELQVRGIYPGGIFANKAPTPNIMMGGRV